ncbi:MAG: DEAD/DEAH box helicase [Candidatus Omnitrophota bacterium]
MQQIHERQLFDFFHPLVRQWFEENVGTPTDIQSRAWPEIASGNHVLVTAPTGSGKTLTAFLWAINRFLSHPESKASMRVLYISPLKALNNDIQRNLEKPLDELRRYFDAAGEPFPLIRTAVRSGDTDPSERRKMRRFPPEILITTPESLNILLTSKSGRRLLTGISTVILDEIHAVLPNKRGTYLITAVDRLVPLCGEFQRIALSATVKPLTAVADFIGGYRLIQSGNHVDYQKRKVSIIRSTISKNYNIQVHFPEMPGNRPPDSEVWWPALVDEWNTIINNNHSTLFFANSRRTVEKITRLINESGQERVYSHHGSLSKEIRQVVEKRFKDGELAAIIATSSLELGIDIGSVDEVVLVQSPFSIASAIQRIGRSGHGVGQVSSGVFYPLHRHNLIASAVIAANIDHESIESMKPVEAPLDVLAQVILSMTAEQEWKIDDLYHAICASYPYHRLNKNEYDLVLDMLSGRYADSRIRELRARLLVDRVSHTVKARENIDWLLYTSGGVIPDRGYFNLRDIETRAKIGELDEEFVWERSLGDAFPLGNQIWRIQRVTHNDVEVSRVSKSNSLVPFWRADEMNRSHHLSQKIGEFLEEAEEKLNAPDFSRQLQRDNHMSERAARELIDYLVRQKKETHAPLPHRHHLLVEHFRDPVNRSDAKQTLFHTLWGGPVNRPLGFALAAAWEEKYHYPLEIFVNNDCIMLNLPHVVNAADILSLVSADNIHRYLRMKLESTGYFGARFRENAQRALLLTKPSFHQRMPLWLNRLRSKKLLEAVSHYEDFPVLLETWRECLNYEFEIDILLNLLEEIRNGDIRITEVNTQTPSPFADNIIWKQTNQYMYEDDSPGSKLRTGLSEALLKEVMVSSQLRPRFSEALIRSFQEKVQRIALGYAPASTDELLQWIKERLYIPAREWEELSVAIERDDAVKAETLLSPIADRLYRHFTGSTHETFSGILALENLPRVSHALGIATDDAHAVARRLSLTRVFSTDPDEQLVTFLNEWLRYYGPVTEDFVQSALHLNAKRLASALETLVEEGRVIIDEFRDTENTSSSEPNKSFAGVQGSSFTKRDCIPRPLVKEEICEVENIEILLRMRRSQARPAIEPLGIDALPLFLAVYHGLVNPGDTPERLQECFEKLFGYPARAGLWESELLPARMKPYYLTWLDTVMRDTDLIWFGSGKERIGFCFESDVELFSYSHGIQQSDPPEDENDEKNQNEDENENQEDEAGERPSIPLNGRDILEKTFFETGGKYDLSTLSQVTGLDSDRLSAALWEMAWEGRITNDSFKVVRSGVMNRFQPEHPMDVRSAGHSVRRFNFNRWSASRPFTGNWYGLRRMDTEPADALDRQELIKDRVRQLFSRYGVLFRELLGNELPDLRWSVIFPVLRLMELSGEVVSGPFFKGVPGLQFCLPSVLGRLTKELPADAIYWMNATDPISPCGIGLEALKPLFPHRLPTTHLVFHGRRLVLVSKKNGKELHVDVEPTHPQLSDYLSFFNILIDREFQPLTYISVDRINDQPVLDSPYKKPFIDFGFTKDYKSLTLVKKYL